MIDPVQWGASARFFTKEQLDQMVKAALCVLEQTGVHMPLSPKRCDALADMGVRVDREAGRLFFPEKVVDQALSRAPIRLQPLRPVAGK